MYFKYLLRIMLHCDIIRIAARHGWLVSVTSTGDGSYYFDFQRRTPGGLQFCFTAELSGGRVGTLLDEIISFVDALEPERYAGEWLEATGKPTPAQYFQAVADMDDVRTRAWLLVFDLSELAEWQSRLLDLPPCMMN